MWKSSHLCLSEIYHELLSCAQRHLYCLIVYRNFHIDNILIYQTLKSHICTFFQEAQYCHSFCQLTNWSMQTLTFQCAQQPPSLPYRPCCFCFVARKKYVRGAKPSLEATRGMAPCLQEEGRETRGGLSFFSICEGCFFGLERIMEQIPTGFLPRQSRGRAQADHPSGLRNK